MRRELLRGALGASLLLGAVSAQGEETEAKPVPKAGAAPAPGAEPKPGPAAEPKPEPTEARATEGASAGENEGENGRLPLSYVERPLTLPRSILEPVVGFEVVKDDATFVNLGVGLAFGITDDFEVQANVAPLQLSPSRTYGQREQPGPAIGTTYRLSHRGLEVGVHLDATLFTLPGTSGVIVRPGFAFRGHAGKRARIDFGAFLPVTSSHTTTAGLQLPFALAIDVAEPVHLGISSGITLQSFDPFSSLDIRSGSSAGTRSGGRTGRSWTSIRSSAGRSWRRATRGRSGRAPPRRGSSGWRSGDSCICEPRPRAATPRSEKRLRRCSTVRSTS